MLKLTHYRFRSTQVLVLLTGILLTVGCSSTTEPSPSVDPAVISLGKQVYDVNCASCHGPNGEGQPNWKRPDATGVMPAPPHDSSGHTWHHPDSQLLEIIAKGSPLPGSKMIGYESILSQEEMEASLAYIKTFWGESEISAQSKLNR